MRSTELRRGLIASATLAGLVAIGRDMRRARRAAGLEPPAPRIAVRVDPPTTAATTSTEHRERRAPPRPIRLVALGDSAIAGVGATRLSGCLAVQLAEHVAAGCGRPVSVHAHGMSGARTADVARQMLELEPADPPDAIVVVVGTNDVAHTTPPWRYARAVAQVHRDLRDRFRVPVIACSLPEFRVITAVGTPLRQLAVGYGLLLSGLQRLVLWRMPGVWWVDARRLAGPAFLRLPQAMSRDGYHPSDLGYSLLAEALAPGVVAALRTSTVCDAVAT